MDLISIKARTKSGETSTFQVLEILEINGRPYDSTTTEELREYTVHLDGRITALEHLIQPTFHHTEMNTEAIHGG